MLGSSGGHRSLFTSKTPSGRTYLDPGPGSLTRPVTHSPAATGDLLPSRETSPQPQQGQQGQRGQVPPSPTGSPQPMTNMGVKMLGPLPQEEATLAGGWG